MTSSRLTNPPRYLRLDGQPLTAVGRLRMYVCGITPYDVTHLGHASTYIWADLADRVLTWQGHTVTVARNVTDVDDVLFAAAQRRGQPATMFGALQRAAFEATMNTLRVRTPDHQPTAAQSVGHVIALASALIARDAAYVRNGSVYARTWDAAGQVGIDNKTALALAAEYRDSPEDPAKEDPLDVAIWRASAGSEHQEVFWPSPWGPGRPGWHAECAAMVLTLFGPTVDLHCGGADLAFPHHACEASLAQQATGVTPFARSWLRAGVVSVEGEKMAKSTGNLVLVDELLREHSPAALRLLCLSRPYAQAWDFSSDALAAAEIQLESLYSAAGRVDGSATEPAQIADLLLDGLDVVGALRVATESGLAARTLIDVLALS